MSEPAAELPISDAREQLADVVNRAFYGGQATYITRRGQRLAVVASPAKLVVDMAHETYRAVEESNRRMWANISSNPDLDEEFLAAVRNAIDAAMKLAEDALDSAMYRASAADRAAGVEPVPWDKVKADLGL